MTRCFTVRSEITLRQLKVALMTFLVAEAEIAGVLLREIAVHRGL